MYRLRVLFWMYEQHPEWEKELRKVPCGPLQNLLSIVKALRLGNVNGLKSICKDYYNEELIDILAGTYMEPELLPLFRNTDDEMLEYVLDKVKDTQQNNPVDFHLFLDSLTDGRKKHRMELLQRYYDFCRINEYICDGTFTENPKGETTERDFMLLAMREAYARHIPEALANMEKALKLHNKNATGFNAEKNVFAAM